jgi:YgiT-type zinc finger domain-containing protein
MKKEFACPMCGKGTVISIAKQGRMVTHRGICLEIPKDIKIPECDHCGERFFDEATVKQVDAKLDKILEINKILENYYKRKKK